MKLFLRAFSVIIFLLVIDIVFIACRKPKEYKYKYTQAAFRLTARDYTTETLVRYLDNDFDTAKIEDLFISVEMRSELISFINNRPNGFFINSAYAFQFYDNYTNTSKLSRISLKTLKDLDQNYSAGDDITDSLLFSNNYLAKDSLPLMEFIDEYNKRNNIYLKMDCLGVISG